MRSFDVPYVPNVPYNPYPAPALQDMSLEEIRKKYIKTCAKANGNVSECSKCKSPCPEGKRAIQLTANLVYNDPPVPLYGGKTLIERAREENLRNRMKAEQKEELVVKKSEDGRMFIEDWYRKAVESGDAVKWVMETYGFTKAKAQQKICQWKIRHPEQKVEAKEEEKPEEPVVVKPEVSDLSIESKLEALMRQQEEQKKVMAEYQRLYDEARIEYEKIKQKTDVLCNALDIMNEN